MEICSVRWSTPCTVLITGPTKSGKTTFVNNLMKDRKLLFNPVPKTVIYFYKVWQDEYSIMKNSETPITFINTIPQSSDAFKSLVSPYKNTGSIVIFDDFADEISQNHMMFTEIWTVLSHHLNCTVIGIIHNLFMKNLRTISLNTHKVVLMNNARDMSQISHLGRQSFPNTGGFLEKSYKHAMSDRDGFPHLIVNFTPGEKYLKVMSNLFRENAPYIRVYRERECTHHKGMNSNPYEKLVLIDENLLECMRSGTNGLKTNYEHVETSIGANASSSNNINISNSGDGYGGGNIPSVSKDDQHNTKSTLESSNRDTQSHQNMLPSIPPTGPKPTISPPAPKTPRKSYPRRNNLTSLPSSSKSSLQEKSSSVPGDAYVPKSSFPPLKKIFQKTNTSTSPPSSTLAGGLLTATSARGSVMGKKKSSVRNNKVTSTSQDIQLTHPTSQTVPIKPMKVNRYRDKARVNASPLNNNSKKLQSNKISSSHNNIGEYTLPMDTQHSSKSMNVSGLLGKRRLKNVSDRRVPLPSKKVKNNRGDKRKNTSDRGGRRKMQIVTKYDKNNLNNIDYDRWTL